MMNSPLSVANAEAQDTVHRAMYKHLTGETLLWTPEVDKCVRSYFELQSLDLQEESPLQMFANYGISLGIAQSLYELGQISKSALGKMYAFSSSQMGKKLLPWNGRAFAVSSGFGTPPEAPSYH